jgi:adenylate cyclase
LGCARQQRSHRRLWIYRNLVSSFAGAGRIEDAEKAYAEVTRSYPDLTISKFKQAMVFSPAALDRMAENLRKIGLPE